jgi:hypothetical protein
MCPKPESAFRSLQINYIKNKRKSHYPEGADFHKKRAFFKKFPEKSGSGAFCRKKETAPEGHRKEFSAGKKPPPLSGALCSTLA